MGSRKKKGNRASEASPDTSPHKVEIGELIPQPQGGGLRRGNPGNKGGPGVAKDAFRKACRDAFNDLDAISIVQSIADGTMRATIGHADGVAVIGPPKHDQRQHALEFLKDNGFGKAPLVVEIEESAGGSRFQTGEEAMKWLLETTGRILRVMAPDPIARAELLDAMVEDRDPMARLAAKEIILSAQPEVAEVERIDKEEGPGASKKEEEAAPKG